MQPYPYPLPNSWHLPINSHLRHCSSAPLPDLVGSHQRCRQSLPDQPYSPSPFSASPSLFLHKLAMVPFPRIALFLVSSSSAARIFTIADCRLLTPRLPSRYCCQPYPLLTSITGLQQHPPPPPASLPSVVLLPKTITFIHRFSTKDRELSATAKDRWGAHRRHCRWWLALVATFPLNTVGKVREYILCT